VSVPDEKKIGALIVDDEELARQILRELLQAHPEIQVLAECANGFEAVKAVAEHKPGIIFLDVQMPKLSGFDVLELIGDEIAVIFVTAYDQYAMKAFEVHAVDYLLKPIGRDRFEGALDRAKQRVIEKSRSRDKESTDHTTANATSPTSTAEPGPASLRPLPNATELAAAARPPQQYLERLVVRDGARVTLIPAAKLDYVEAQDDYIALATQGAKHLKQQTIASIEAGLNPARFVRIHRSYIVNFERVVRIEPYGKDSRLAILADGTRLPVSRAGYARLKSLLDDRI
jgi:two-component system LytT family response regulator